MKCSKCGGTGWDVVNGLECISCGGMGEINCSVKDYIRTCTDEELIDLISIIIDPKIVRAWAIKYHCADSDSNAIRLWLKEEM